MFIYKICSEAAWAAASEGGRYEGSADDRRDGFIHFSTAAQLAKTAEKHFAGQRDLLLVAVEAEALGEALRWEASRGGALFPHLYGALEVSRAAWSAPLPWSEEAGAHLMPTLPGEG